MVQMSNLSVRRVLDEETEAAFSVLVRVAAWLEHKGRRQRISKTTLETYMMWQKRGANYAVLDDGLILGVFSLPREPLYEWPKVAIKEPVAWLRALATDPDHHRKGIGTFAVAKALQTVGPPEPLYLDCVSDFLPSYYESLGFETVACQTRTYPEEEHPLDMTLLRHRNVEHRLPTKYPRQDSNLRHPA